MSEIPRNAYARLSKIFAFYPKFKPHFVNFLLKLIYQEFACDICGKIVKKSENNLAFSKSSQLHIKCMNYFFSFNILASNMVDHFVQSNLAGQAIVVILLILSVIAWGVMFCKNSDLNAIDLANKKTQSILSRSSSLMAAVDGKDISGPDAALLKCAVSEWGRSGYGLDDSTESRALRMGHVENALQRTLARQTIMCQSKMTLLGTIISGAPFLGLLGTVWGVMDCFGSMSAQASVTLQDLAPGVAGALLTTVAGLLVAIPSVFGYNYLTTRTRSLVTELENFASLVADRLELESRARDLNTRIEKRKNEIPAAPVKTPQAETPSADATKMIKFSLDDDDDDPLTRKFDD